MQHTLSAYLEMHLLSLLSTITLFSSLTSANPLDDTSLLLARQTNTEQDYLNSVCLPNVTTTPIPPCQQIANIESACQPNGTAPLDYLAHTQCMCGGGYFPNWFGCLNCEYIHGGRTQAQSIAFSQILTSASNMLCTGTPTASFAAIFSSLSDTHPVVASTAGTGTTDLYPSQTAVSLYYTASGPQGEGAITGSAAAATKVPSSAAASTTAGAGGSMTTAGAAPTGGSSTTGGSASEASKTSSSGAAATNGLAGLLGIVAGGVVVAAL
jgi:hypothetical protein